MTVHFTTPINILDALFTC